MLRNGFYNVPGAGTRIGLSIIIVPLLIRFLGVQEYGLWAFVSAVIGIVGLAEAGLSVSTTVFLSKDLARNETGGMTQTLTIILGAMLLLATLAVVSLWLGSSNIATLLPGLSQDQYSVVSKALRLGGLVVWAQLLQQIFVGVEQAYQKYGLINIINTLQITLINLGMLGVAWFGGQIKTLVQWQAIVGLIFLIIHFGVSLFLLKGNKIKLSWNRAKAIKIIKYSLTTWLGSVGITLFNKSDRLIVGSILGAGVLGVYSAITSIAAQINSFSAVAIQPLLPLASKQITETGLSDTTLKAKVKQALEVNTLLALGIGGLLVSFTPEITRLIIPGISASRHAVELYIAVIIYSLYSLNAVGYYILLSLGLAGSFTIIVLIGGGLSLTLIAAGSSNFGLIGAIMGNAGYLLVWLLTLLAMRKLRVPLKTWVGWIVLPMACFFTFSLISIVSHGSTMYRILTLVLYFIVLATWFESLQRTGFQYLRRGSVNPKIIYKLFKIQHRILLQIYRIRCAFPVRKLSRFSLIDGSRFDYPLRSAIGRALFCGGFETVEARYLEKTLEPGDIFLDIGANGGFFTIIAARKVGESGHVYAFEPGESELELLRHNIEINSLTNVSIIESAVSNKSGITHFALSQDGAMNSMAKNDHPGQKIKEWTVVNTTTIDDFFEEYGLSKVDFIKVDVEGAEKLVFEGLSKTLSLNQEVQIMFESSDLNSVGFDYSVKEFIEEILRLEMKLYYFDGGSGALVNIKNHNHQLGRKVYNFLAKRN